MLKHAYLSANGNLKCFSIIFFSESGVLIFMQVVLLGENFHEMLNHVYLQTIDLSHT